MAVAKFFRRMKKKDPVLKILSLHKGVDMELAKKFLADEVLNG
jgi:hypothetical protein